MNKSSRFIVSTISVQRNTFIFSRCVKYKSKVDSRVYQMLHFLFQIRSEKAQFYLVNCGPHLSGFNSFLGGILSLDSDYVNI